MSLVLRLRLTSDTIHLIVPALHRLVPVTIRPDAAVLARYAGGRIELALPGRPVLILNAPQDKQFRQHLEGHGPWAWVMDHHHRYRFRAELVSGNGGGRQ